MLSFELLAVLLLVSFSRASAVCSLCSDFEATLTPGDSTFANKSLAGKYANVTQLTVSHFAQCLYACVHDNCSCMSINYQHNSATHQHICELNAETKADTNHALVERQNFSYIDLVEVKRVSIFFLLQCSSVVKRGNNIHMQGSVYGKIEKSEEAFPGKLRNYIRYP